VANKIKAVMLKSTEQGAEVDLETGHVVLNLARVGGTYYLLLGPNEAQATPIVAEGEDEEGSGPPNGESKPKTEGSAKE